MVDEDKRRPEPEELLKLAQREEAAKKRGKLTIYLGAAPGVGKTFAMLSDGRLQKREGVDVVIGWAEPHGRPETEELLEGMEQIPPVDIEYRGFHLKDFDLDATLERKPKLVLVDEFAHTNAPGMRHVKRYQDVEELLDAGIDVYTTMNVQHLESLNDVINQIIAIKVRETVPDTIVDRAEEIKLIDLPPEELIKRLHEGKVYVKDIVGIAVEKYFRPGNLLALRELALRVVAGTVDERMRQYMREYAISGIWPAQERVLVAIFASPYAEKLVRSAYRLASELDAELVAFHVETEKSKDFTGQETAWLKSALGLAQKFGARIVWIKGTDVASEISDYAQKNNITKVVIGKPRRHYPLFPPLSTNILINTPNIDVYLIDPGTGKVEFPSRQEKKSRLLPLAYLASLAGVATITFLAFLIKDYIDQIDVLFLLLIPPVLSGLYYGRGPSYASAIASLLAFDYFFVQPVYSFWIDDMTILISFLIFMGTVFLVSHLAYRHRSKSQLLKASEAKSITLYGLSRDLIVAKNIEQVLSLLLRHARQLFPSELAVFMEEDGRMIVKAKTDGFEINTEISGVASWVLANKHKAGRGTSTLPSSPAVFIPMLFEEELEGVLGISGDPAVLESQEQQVVLDTIASLGAMALNRVRK